MKSLIFLSFLTVSFSSIACPILKGTYECGDNIQTIKQHKEQSGVTTYVINSSHVNQYVITDGMERKFENDLVKATCSEGQVIVTYSSGLFKTTEKLFLDEERNLVKKTVNFLIPDTEVCFRL